MTKEEALDALKEIYEFWLGYSPMDVLIDGVPLKEALEGMGRDIRISELEGDAGIKKLVDILIEEYTNAKAQINVEHKTSSAWIEEWQRTDGAGTLVTLRAIKIDSP